MADMRDIQELREATKELRQLADNLKDKITNDVNNAFGISRELHQKQALIIAKIEVRLEAIENQNKLLLYILQGDGTHRGVVSRLDVLEQNVKIVEDSNKSQDGTIQEIRNRSNPCVLHEDRIRRVEDKVNSLDDRFKEVQGEVDSEKKEVLDLKTERAKLKGGWSAIGIVIAVITGAFALVVQIWNLFHP